MNILWVEDFDAGKGNPAVLTGEWLTDILSTDAKEKLAGLTNPRKDSDDPSRSQEPLGNGVDPLSFLKILAGNDSPIVWADSLAAGLAASRLGTAAYKENKFFKIPRVEAAYEVALLDLDIPYGKDAGQLSKAYSESAQDLLDAEEKNSTFDLQDPGLKALPGAILAIRLLQGGMPADRIFFLTANADLSSMPASIKSIVGPEHLKKCIVDKHKIDELLRRVENNAYYQLKMLINNVSQEVISFIEQADFIGATQEEFNFKESGTFLFETKKDTINFLNELIDMLPLHHKENDKILCHILIDKILREFDKISYRHPPYDRNYPDSAPARFYARNLKFLRNINAHTPYLKNVTECEAGITFLLFIGFLIELYRDKDNNKQDCTNIVSTAKKFFDNESILNKEFDYRSDNQFIHTVGRLYTEIVKKDTNPSNYYDNWFINITADLPDNLNLSAWHALRMTFWSQVSYTSEGISGIRYFFDNNTTELRKQPFFSMLANRLALSEK